MTSTRWLACAVIWFSFGCGAETSAEGTSTTTSTTTAPSESTGEPPLACPDYASADAVGPDVVVTVRHEGMNPVYFHPTGCGGALTFEITEVASGDVVPYSLGECTPVLCDDFMVLSDCSQGCNDCAPPGAGVFNPGAVADGTWNGAWLVPLTMSEMCGPGANCQAACQRRDAAPPGKYRIGLTINRTCIGGCECDDPMPEGGTCSLFGGTQLGYPQTFTAEINYPAETTATIVLTD